MPACCLTSPPTPPEWRASESSAAQAWAALCFSCLILVSPPSLTEWRIVAKLLRSVDSLLTWDISSASHFPLEVETHCKQHLGSYQHHQWTKMGLFICSKSHNQNAQRELDKNSGPGYCLSRKVLSCTVQKSATFLPAFVSWMKCFWGYLWKEWSWGRKEAVGFMAPWSYYWPWPSLWLPLNKEYANTWGSKFYSWYLFVSSLCLGM